MTLWFQPDPSDEEAEGMLQPGVNPEDDGTPAERFDKDDAIAKLSKVKIRLDETPKGLDRRRFLASMIERVLRATPVDIHTEARKRRAQASAP